MESKIYNVVHLISLFNILFVFNSCSLLDTSLRIFKQDFNVDKHYIGKGDTENFHRGIESVLFQFGYQIEEYDNGPTASYVTTGWKIRDPYADEIEKGFLEIKTRIIINGIVDNSSFSSINSFSYDCFMEVRNFVFDGEKYIEYHDDKHLKEEVNYIIKSFSYFFSNEKTTR